MPIEVRELVIRARIEEPPPQSAGNGRVPGRKMDDREFQSLIATCAEEVLRILERKQAR
jgi:hypothetical protein